MPVRPCYDGACGAGAPAMEHWCARGVPPARATRRTDPMLYALLCYNSEEMVCAWTKEEDDAVMAKLSKVHEKWEHA